MSDKIYFTYERMEPYRYPEPRDIRSQLERHMTNRYKNESLSKITLSTEFILKNIVVKDGSPELPLLKYKVINLDWEDTRGFDNIIFDKKMFKWSKADLLNY